MGLHQPEGLGVPDCTSVVHVCSPPAICVTQTTHWCWHSRRLICSKRNPEGGKIWTKRTSSFDTSDSMQSACKYPHFSLFGVSSFCKTKKVWRQEFVELYIMNRVSFCPTLWWNNFLLLKPYQAGLPRRPHTEGRCFPCSEKIQLSSIVDAPIISKETVETLVIDSGRFSEDPQRSCRWD